MAAGPNRRSSEDAASEETAPKSAPPNAFRAQFLRFAEQRDEPPTATEAEFAGPWRRQHGESGNAMLRSWEEPRQGDRPFASFSDDQTAQLALALLPARGALGTYQLSQEEHGEGFLLQRNGRPVGHLAYFDEHFVEALSALEALIKNPLALANLLEAAGPTALEQTGRILSRQMEEE